MFALKPLWKVSIYACLCSEYKVCFQKDIVELVSELSELTVFSFCSATLQFVFISTHIKIYRRALFMDNNVFILSTVLYWKRILSTEILFVLLISSGGILKLNIYQTAQIILFEKYGLCKFYICLHIVYYLNNLYSTKMQICKYMGIFFVGLQ